MSDALIVLGLSIISIISIGCVCGLILAEWGEKRGLYKGNRK